MKVKPFVYLIVGIAFLVVPTTIYLIFLVPKLSEQYNVLMASGGVLGGFGYIGAEKIPSSIKYSSLFKTASRSYTTLIVCMLIQDFLPQIIGLVATIITSVIIFLIFKGVYNNAKRKLENRELANEIARSIDKTIK